MLASITLKRLIVGSALVVLVTSTVPGSTSFLHADVTPAIPTGKVGEQHAPEKRPIPSPPRTESPSSYVSPQVPSPKCQIPKKPRQAMLFEVLGTDVTVVTEQGKPIASLASPDLTRLVIKTGNDSSLHKIDPDGILEDTGYTHVPDMHTIAVSNNGKFTVKVMDRLITETGSPQGTSTKWESHVVVYMGDWAGTEGRFPHNGGMMQASFSHDSSWALIRSPSNALQLWKVADETGKEPPRDFDISSAATAAAIGDDIFAYVEGGYLVVKKLDVDQTPLLRTTLRNFGRIHRMVIHENRIGMIQGHHFTSYNLDGTLHARDYRIDVDGSEITSLAFHDTHLALIGPKDRLYVYDLNKPVTQARTRRQLDKVILKRDCQYVDVRALGSDSFEALEAIFAGDNQLKFRLHHVLLESGDAEQTIDMTALLPSVLWSLVGSYLPKPRVMRQLSGRFVPLPEDPQAEPLYAMTKPIALKFKRIPLACAVDGRIAYVAVHDAESRDGPDQLLSFDLHTKKSHHLIDVPPSVAISKIFPSPGSHRFVLVATSGAVHVPSFKPNQFHIIEQFKWDATTRVYMHPFQPFSFIYHNGTLYVVKYPIEPLGVIELFARNVKKSKAPAPITSAHFGYPMQDLFVKGEKLHRFTYINILPGV